MDYAKNVPQQNRNCGRLLQTVKNPPLQPTNHKCSITKKFNLYDLEPNENTKQEIGSKDTCSQQLDIKGPLRDVQNLQLVSAYNKKVFGFQNMTSPRLNPVFQNSDTTRKWALCSLCRKNGEPVEIYSSHNIKSEDGKVTCPVLRKHICDVCGATGDYAHTRSHCPKYLEAKDKAKPRPTFRILSNGKPCKMIHHK